MVAVRIYVFVIRWTGQRQHILNDSYLNRSNFKIHDWSWNYRGCWHQTCPPIGTHHGYWVCFIPITIQLWNVLLFVVTTPATRPVLIFDADGGNACLICSIWMQAVKALPIDLLYLNDVQLEVSDKLPQRCQFAKHKHPKHIQVTVCPNATLYLLCMCFPP